MADNDNPSEIQAETQETKFVELPTEDGGNLLLMRDGIESEQVEPTIDEEASTALRKYQKHVLAPFNVLLKAIGLRVFGGSSAAGGCFHHCCFKFINFVYPMMVFVLLAVGAVTQLASCFFRYRSKAIMEGSLYNVIECDDKIFTFNIIPYMLILLAYLLSVYSFRVAEPDQLYPLAESAFRSFRGVRVAKSRQRPYHILACIFSVGMLFIVLSMAVSVLRVFALKLENINTIIGWFTDDPSATNQLFHLRLIILVYNIVHYVLVVLALIGYVLVDMVFVAVVINYCSQCQLLTVYIRNIEDRVKNKAYSNLYLAVKDIQGIQDYMRTLNGKISSVTSLFYFIFLVYLILSYSELSAADQPLINRTTGFMNTIQWLIAIVFPALLATHLTAAGNDMRRLGQEVAGCPLYYSNRVHIDSSSLLGIQPGDTAALSNWYSDIHRDIELKFFQQFTESTRYHAKLIFMPMQPALVLGLIVIFMLFLCTGIIIPHLQSVGWF